MIRTLLPLACMALGVLFGVTVLTWAGDALAPHTGRTAAHLIVLGPFVIGAVVLGWRVYGPGRTNR